MNWTRESLDPDIQVYFCLYHNINWTRETMYLWLLHCQLQRHFWRPIVRMCLAKSKNLLLVLQDAPKCIFSMKLRYSGQPKNNALFSTLHPLSLVIFATVVAFVLLRNSRFNFHCYTQCEAMPIHKSAQKWRCDLARLIARKITKGIHSCKPASRNRPY